MTAMTTPRHAVGQHVGQSDGLTPTMPAATTDAGEI
jgi:hypothetical protein